MWIASTWAMAEDKRFVYVLRNADQKPQFYVGLTSDVDARLSDHNTGRNPHTVSVGRGVPTVYDHLD
jgi:predicted GIY-YIG superfamily endonuclease